MSRAQLNIFMMLSMLVIAMLPHMALASDNSNYTNPYANAADAQIGFDRNGVNFNVQGTLNNTANQALQPVNNAVSGVTTGVNNAVNGVTSGVTNGINNLLGGLFPGFQKSNAPPTATAATFSNVKKLDEICKFNTDPNEGLNIISKSVECFESMFMGIVTEKLRGMTDFMREAVFAAMVLYVIFYGIKTSTGMVTEQRAKGEFFIHALKIAFVSWMIMNYGILELWFLTIDIYNGMLDLVMIMPEMDTCQVTAKNVQAMWISMDCILTEFIGWNATNAHGKWEGVPLLFGMFTHAFKSGAGGSFIAILVFMSILTLVMSLMRVAFVYILSMMGLILAFMISPIMIPFMLFPQTKQMFDGWWKLIVSMVMQPVIIFAYLSFMMSIMMEVISGPGGLTEIYGYVEPAYEVGGQRTTGTATSITTVFRMFEYNQYDRPFEPEIVFNLLSIFVVAYLLNAFTSFVGTMAVELSGNALSPNLTAGVPGFLGGGRG